VNGEFWAIVSDEPTALHTFEEYSLRFDIVALASRRVEVFLDDQFSWLESEGVQIFV
ncbi:hypothetical protein H6G62_13395, partial [Phormidium sp. FACHB-1136]|nr:hypothetical protein [Phormidium sp. FACHB-1136]